VGAAATITFLAKILISSHNDDEPNTLYHWNKKVRPNTRLYLLGLDFITTEFSQTKLNRFIWLISDDPNLGEEPKKTPMRPAVTGLTHENHQEE